MMARAPLLVAHRAANDRHELAAAEASGVDVLECDLHWFRGRVEVRHAKTVGPVAVLWERWHLVRPFSPRATLADLLRWASPSTHLMLDLKGPFTALGRQVATEIADRRPVTVCARNWWLLRPFADLEGVGVIRSVGNRAQVRRVLRGTGPIGAVSVRDRLLSDAVTRELVRRASQVFVWGVVTATRYQALRRAGVRGFIVDPPLLSDLLADRACSGNSRTTCA